MKTDTIRFTKSHGRFQIDRNIPKAVDDKWTNQEWQEFCTNLDSILDPFNGFTSFGCCCCSFCPAITLFVLTILFIVAYFTSDDCDTCFVVYVLETDILPVMIPLTIVILWLVTPAMYFGVLGSKYGSAIQEMETLVLNESKTRADLSIHVRSNWTRRWFEIYKWPTFEDDYIECVSTVEEVLERI
jgi:hypothetical protein